LKLGMAVEHAEVTGGNPRSVPVPARDRPRARVVGHLATLDLNKGTNDLILAVAPPEPLAAEDEAIP
jgi:hypothetical protein